MQIRTIVRTLGAAIGLALLLSQASSAAVVRFGAKLTNTVQPSNAGTGHFCNNQHSNCTWILMQAYSRLNGQLAPKDGSVSKIRLIACFPGQFKIAIARANPNTQNATVITTGQTIAFDGDGDHCSNSTYDIETFTLAKPLPVKKGDYLAITTPKALTLRCDSGGPEILQFVPPLTGGPYRHRTDTDGCYLLIEAQYL